MLKKLISFFRHPAATHKPKDLVNADQIRKYVKVTYVTPARQQGRKRVSVSAEAIHAGMGLHSKYAMVCGAIDARKFQEFARVKVENRTGSKEGSSARWTFVIN